MGGDLPADRTQEQAEEAAAPAVPEHDEVHVVEVEEHRGRLAAHRLGADGHIAAAAWA
ncbi:hypothetical protein GCM10020358_12260 [Amorphoplanes nipponensis]